MAWGQGRGPELIWSIGDLATETGAAVTNFTSNGQKWFDFATTPTTVGQMIGTSGTIHANAKLNIDTEGCDFLAISFAGKITAVGTQTAATSSALYPYAFGTPFPVKSTSPTAWQYPAAFQGGAAPVNTPATGVLNNDSLWCFGDGYTTNGAKGGSTNGHLNQNALQIADGTNPVAGDYLRWHFFIGRRQAHDTDQLVSTARGFVEPSLIGISRVTLALLVLNAATAGSDTQSMAAQMYVHRIYRNAAGTR